jgi:hypothetical protein
VIALLRPAYQRSAMVSERSAYQRNDSIAYASATGVTRTRPAYGHGCVEAAPLDARLHLPRRQYSYLFQQWFGAFVIDDAYAEAIKKLQTILRLGLSVKASEDLNREQAGDVEPFQNHLTTPDPTEEGPILVVTADCKGDALGAFGVGSRAGRRRGQGGSAAVGGEPSPWQGTEGEQEADGGGGGGLHDRAVRPHPGRGDEEEGRQTPPEADA